MTVTFTKDSNFNPNANFTRIKFGHDSTLLEVELNELQKIQLDNVRKLTESIVGEGILHLGTLTVAASKLTLTNEVVISDGFVSYIPSVSINVATGNTVYLNVSEKEVTFLDVIKKDGNALSVDTVTNNIRDNRDNEETSRRFQHVYQLSTTLLPQGKNYTLCTIQANNTFTKVKTSNPFMDNAIQGNTDLKEHLENLGGHVSLTDRTKWDGKAEKTLATTSTAGLMSGPDKTKVDGIESGANNYIHPVNHPASIITQDANNRFMTDLERAKLVAIAAGATNYTHPATHPPSIISQDSSNRFVTDALIAAWNAKAPSSLATNLVDGLMDKLDKVKLDGIANNANNYIHPATHPASIIVQDASNRFMTDVERNKLATIASSANNYVHPANHPASIITQDADNRFMTDVERNKLLAIADNANNYVHPVNHPASMIVQDANNRFMTDVERNKLAAIAASANNYVHPATHLPSIIVQDASNRFMTDVERNKLAAIADSANNYSHPASHPPSIIVQDANNRFSTDVEKNNWNGKETTAGAQAKADKAYNDSIAWAQSFGFGGNAINFPTTDLNNITALNGLYNISGATNAPEAGWLFLIHIRHSNVTGYISQIARPFANSKTYTRSCNVGVWSAWVESETTIGSQTKSDKALADSKVWGMNSVSVNSTFDPNTTQDSYMLSNHVNSPGLGLYWHVQTYFYSSLTGNRGQVAVSYSGTPRMMVRNFYSPTWTPWVEMDSTAGAQAKVDLHATNYVSHAGYAVTTGTANVYVATLNPVLAAYVEGVTIRVKINVQNTGASTINVNARGAKAILKSDGTAVNAAMLKVGSIYTLVYNGVSFILQGEGGGLSDSETSGLISSINAIVKM